MRTFKGLGSLKDSSETRVNPQNPSGILGNPQKPTGILGNHSRILGNLRELPEGNRPCTGLSLAARRNVSPYFYSFLFFSPSLYFFLSSLPFPLSFLLSVLVSVFPTLSLLSHSLLLFLILLLPPSAPLPSPPPSHIHQVVNMIDSWGFGDGVGWMGGREDIWIYEYIWTYAGFMINKLELWTVTHAHLTHTPYICVCARVCVWQKVSYYIAYATSMFPMVRLYSTSSTDDKANQKGRTEYLRVLRF